jgi:NAD(P)-dependent dehydrogenase (short-subunit alcohol dehydrogenase family)
MSKIHLPSWACARLAIHQLLLTVSYPGALYCIKHSQGRLAQSITVTTGTAVLRPQRGWALSMGAAGALMTSMRTLAVDLAPLRVNCIVPGAVETEMWDVR